MAQQRAKMASGTKLCLDMIMRGGEFCQQYVARRHTTENKRQGPLWDIRIRHVCSDQDAYTERLVVNKRGRTVETGAVLFSTHLSHLKQPQTLKQKLGKDLQSSRSTEVKLVWLVDLAQK
jgi:hypothetical protein